MTILMQQDGKKASPLFVGFDPENERHIELLVDWLRRFGAGLVHYPAPEFMTDFANETEPR